jgi:hypothetical protein
MSDGATPKGSADEFRKTVEELITPRSIQPSSEQTRSPALADATERTVLRRNRTLPQGRIGRRFVLLNVSEMCLDNPLEIGTGL